MSKTFVLDREQSLKWLEGDERMLDRIRVIFLKNIPQQVQNLQASINDGDTAATERTAHTIMGSAAMIGAASMSAEAKKIEEKAITKDMESARFHFSSFLVEYEKVIMELQPDGGDK
jgi:two-component system sensor histidine kinase/response regulator